MKCPKCGSFEVQRTNVKDVTCTPCNGVSNYYQAYKQTLIDLSEGDRSLVRWQQRWTRDSEGD